MFYVLIIVLSEHRKDVVVMVLITIHYLLYTFIIVAIKQINICSYFDMIYYNFINADPLLQCVPLQVKTSFNVCTLLLCYERYCRKYLLNFTGKFKLI